MKKILWLLLLFLPLTSEAAFDLHDALDNLGLEYGEDDASYKQQQNDAIDAALDSFFEEGYAKPRSLSPLSKEALSDTRPKYLVGSQSDYYQQKLAGDSGDLTRFIQKLINGLTGIVAAIAIYFIVLNAFNLVTAFGDSDRISKAKSGLTWSGVGFLLMVFAYVIVKTIMFITFSGEMAREAEEQKKVEIVTTPAPEIRPPAAAELPPTSNEQLYTIDPVDNGGQIVPDDENSPRTQNELSSTENSSAGGGQGGEPGVGDDIPPRQ